MKPGEIRALRERLGLTQQTMADRLSVPLGTYKNWEYGHRGVKRLSAAVVKLLSDLARETEGGKQ